MVIISHVLCLRLKSKTKWIEWCPNCCWFKGFFGIKTCQDGHSPVSDIVSEYRNLRIRRYPRQIIEFGNGSWNSSSAILCEWLFLPRHPLPMKEFTTADHCTVADHICFQVLGHQSFRTTGGTGPSDDATPEDPKKSLMDGEGGVPKKGCFIMEILLKWMMFGGSPIWGNHHMLLLGTSWSIVDDH